MILENLLKQQRDGNWRGPTPNSQRHRALDSARRRRQCRCRLRGGVHAPNVHAARAVRVEINVLAIGGKIALAGADETPRNLANIFQMSGFLLLPVGGWLSSHGHTDQQGQHRRLLCCSGENLVLFLFAQDDAEK